MFEFQYIELMNWAFWPSIKLPLDRKTIMITGPNGSGKTTFLDAMRTLLRVPRLSGNRRFTDYIAQNVDTAVIKAVIANKVNGDNRRAFEFLGHCTENVTLAVMIRRKGGRWEKRFAVLDGDCDLEQLRNLKASELISPQTFTHLIHEAGCSESLLKVLALEQGQTDKLCEKSPKELLELLLDVHGDKDIIDRYRSAKINYQSAHVEFGQLGARLAEEQAKLLVTRKRAEDYQRYCRLQNEILDYESKLMPQAEYRSAQQGVEMARMAIRDLEQRLSPMDRELVKIQTILDTADTEIIRLENAVVGARDDKTELEKDERERDIRLNTLVQERKRLESLLSEIVDAEPVPIDPLVTQRQQAQRDIVKTELDVEETARQLQDRHAELNLLASKDRRIYPGYVTEFIRALSQQKIKHDLLCDLVEITDNRWQLAIESILGRDRFTIIVDTADQLSARKLGESHRYRGYIAAREYQPNLFESPSSRNQTALDKVQFVDDGIPKWVVDNLGRITLVETVQDGLKLGKGAVSVTAKGYRQDRRGGISIAVDRFYCGSLGQSTQKSRVEQQVAEQEGRIRSAQRLIAELRTKEASLSDRIRIQESLREAESARDRKAELDHDISEANQRHKLALEGRRQAELKLLEALDNLTNFQRDCDEHRRWITGKESEKGDYLSELRDYHETVGEYERRMADIRERVDAELLTEKALRKAPDIDELSPKYYAARNLLEDFTEVPEESAVHIFEHHNKQYEDQERMFQDHRAGLTNWEKEFQLARAKYTHVVEHTIREYRKNINALSQLAGVYADVIMPDFSNADDILDDAELRVRFGFDGKSAIDIGGTTHSGGQRVVASLILLMSMATSGGINRGGFFIIDEPFAHLSIERIDDISQFLEKSQCQFILTSPTTHNVNVFSAARLQLNFRIKQAQSEYAPVPTVIRR